MSHWVGGGLWAVSWVVKSWGILIFTDHFTGLTGKIFHLYHQSQWSTTVSVRLQGCVHKNFSYLRLTRCISKETTNDWAWKCVAWFTTTDWETSEIRQLQKLKNNLQAHVTFNFRINLAQQLSHHILIGNRIEALIPLIGLRSSAHYTTVPYTTDTDFRRSGVNTFIKSASKENREKGAVWKLR